MLCNEDFIQQSLDLNLFFLRIMKEHSFFLEAAFVPKDQTLAQQAETFKCEFTALLTEALMLADGTVSPAVCTSGELVTEFTCDAEQTTEFYSGISLDPELTRMELSLGRNINPTINILLLDQINELNQKAITAATALAEFKFRLLQEVLDCKLFTFNYPSLIDHILREANSYLKTLYQLQNRQIVNLVDDIINQEQFWNRIMAEHAKLILGLLDPTETALFKTANDFGKLFDTLEAKALSMTEHTTILPELSLETYEATKDLRDFKAAGTEGLLQCRIKAIAMPLLADHVLREANHYLRILNTFNARLE